MTLLSSIFDLGIKPKAKKKSLFILIGKKKR